MTNNPATGDINVVDRRPIVLDFTNHGMLPGPLLRRLDEIALERSSEFNAMIALLSEGLERDIDWWVTWPATRNTHVSKLFTRCVQLALVEELEARSAQLEIIVDDHALAQVLAQGRPRKIISRPGTSSLRKALHNLASSLFNSTTAFLAARLTARGEAASHSPILVVEEGINETTFADGIKTEHYYPGLREKIAPADARGLHIMPVFYRVKSYFRLLRLIRASSIPFIVREDHFVLADYLFAAGHWFRVRRFLGRDQSFAGFSVGPLIDADIKEGRFTNAVFQALLSYRFWRKAKRRGIHVKQLLDWYEGHDRDHATAAAINWSGLPIRHVAYRHMSGPLYLGAIPVQHEIDAGVVPKQFAIVGRKAADALKSEVRGLTIHEVPSLRFAQLGTISRHQGQAQILVLLGLQESLLRSVHAMLVPALTMPELRHVTWLLRAHPLTPSAVIDATFGPLPSNVRLAKGDFRTNLQQADIAVGIATNALLEALVAGVPVIMLAGGNEPTEKPIPSWIDGARAGTCYDASELASMILAMLRDAQSGEMTNGLRTDLVGDAASSGLSDALG